MIVSSIQSEFVIGKGRDRMKENKYDDAKFFDKYSQMDRSRKGLEGAGE